MPNLSISSSSKLHVNKTSVTCVFGVTSSILAILDPKVPRVFGTLLGIKIFGLLYFWARDDWAKDFSAYGIWAKDVWAKFTIKVTFGPKNIS